MFIGRTDAEAEAPILWPPDAKNWLTGKNPEAWKNWRQEKKDVIEQKMFGWHHWLDGHEFEQAPGVGHGQGMLQSMGSQRVRHDWAKTELNPVIFFVKTQDSFATLKIYFISKDLSCKRKKNGKNFSDNRDFDSFPYRVREQILMNSQELSGAVSQDGQKTERLLLLSSSHCSKWDQATPLEIEAGECNRMRNVQA